MPGTAKNLTGKPSKLHGRRRGSAAPSPLAPDLARLASDSDCRQRRRGLLSSRKGVVPYGFQWLLVEGGHTTARGLWTTPVVLSAVILLVVGITPMPALAFEDEYYSGLYTKNGTFEDDWFYDAYDVADNADR